MRVTSYSVILSIPKLDSPSHCYIIQINWNPRLEDLIDT